MDGHQTLIRFWVSGNSTFLSSGRACFATMASLASRVLSQMIFPSDVATITPPMLPASGAAMSTVTAGAGVLVADWYCALAGSMHSVTTPESLCKHLTLSVDLLPKRLMACAGGRACVCVRERERERKREREK